MSGIFHAVGVSGRGDISSVDGNGEQQELPEVAPVSGSCRRVVAGASGLALAAVIGVVVLHVSRAALAKTLAETVVTCSVTEEKRSINNQCPLFALGQSIHHYLFP